MAKPSSSLAKLTRPRLHEAVERARLFARLDQAHGRRAALCIVGPPGAGKTTLVATWLDRRQIPGIWYQVDAGDADLATLFYYLGEASRPFERRDRPALPLLTPEYQHDVAGFSRRFFRELFGVLPEGATLVLDNYQEVDARHPFHALMAEAIAEIPAQRMLLVVSRRDPPDCYARLVVNQNVELVDGDDLKLNLEETTAIARARLPRVSECEIEQLYERSGGWAAGLTLLLEGFRRSHVGSRGLGAEREAIFAYFASQIFERLPAAIRHVLAVTSLLPQVPVSLARELTGDPRAADILEDLYKRHLFTHRRTGSEPVYWYHALFRSFLREKAEGVLGADLLRETQRRAARLMVAHGDYDDAYQLFREVQDWPAAQRLIERYAETLLAKGRGQTLREWIVALPPATLENAPWSRYWLGTSLIPLDQKEARIHLERAFAQFAADGDSMAQALAVAGVIESYYYEWAEFQPLRRWLDTLAALLERIRLSGDFHAERRVYTSLLVGILYAAPGHVLLRRTVSRVTEMLDEDMDVNSKASTAMCLLSYSNLACDLERAKHASLCIEPLLDHPELTPLNRSWCHLRLGYYYYLIGRYEDGLRSLGKATSIRETHGLRGLRGTVLLTCHYQTYCHVMLGDLRGARKCSAQVMEAADPMRPTDRFSVSNACAHLEAGAGNYLRLAQHAASVTAHAVAAGMPYVEILGAQSEATGWAVIGNIPQLRDALSRLRQLIAGTCFSFEECAARFLETYAELCHGHPERGRRLLPQAIAIARELRYQYPQMARSSVVTGTVLAEALHAGVEPEYVRETIRRLRIRPPSDAPASWPWPIKVVTLGRFEVVRDDHRLEFSGRAPRKVLAVLKAIVAGGGTPVSIASLVDALWPEDDGDAARKALDVALVRLRRLLTCAEAVVVRDEQVSLNQDLCWVDAWAFARNAEALSRMGEMLRPRLEAAQRSLETYRGSFLPGEPEEKAIVVMRLKLRDLLARLVSTSAAQLEANGEWEAALACYRRGIDADELAEEFYQGVMRCYAATGRSAEGIAAFRRLRQTLSVVLGVEPSARSAQLMRLLSDAGSNKHAQPPACGPHRVGRDAL